jgi:hypothetical protein
MSPPRPQTWSILHLQSSILVFSFPSLIPSPTLSLIGMAKGKKSEGNDSGLNFEGQFWAAVHKMRGLMNALEYKHVRLGLKPHPLVYTN